MQTEQASGAKTSGSDVAEKWPQVPWDNGSYRGTHDTGKLWRDAGIPERHRGKVGIRHDAAGGWGEAYRRLASAVADGGLVVLLGPRGTGKTQLAACLLADVCRKGKAVRYVKAMDLYREVRSCYRKDGPDEVKTVDRICALGGLAIDEAHTVSDSVWENLTLTNIVDRRYDSVLPTILLSNHTRDEFAAAVGPAIVSRIHECGTVVVCDWPSFRRPGGGAN